MKRLIFLLTAIFICTCLHAQTETINWYVDGNVYQTTTCESGGDIILPATPTKRGYTFIGWGGYTPIEYLESTGTQYIDTGVVPNDYGGLQWAIDVIPVVSKNTYNIVCGAEMPRIMGPEFLPSGKIGWGWSNKYGSTTRDFSWGTKYYFNVKAVSGDYSITMDGINIFQSTDSITQTNNKLYLFADNLNGKPSLYAAVKMYSFKLWNSDHSLLLRDFIPVLDKNGIPCMYDKVEGKFYYNAGTGDFIAGPVIGDGTNNE